MTKWLKSALVLAVLWRVAVVQAFDPACGSCGNATLSDPTTLPLCRCDADCPTYGDCCSDCCSDRPQSDVETPLGRLAGLQCRATQNVFVPEYLSPADTGNYWMVSTCPEDWPADGDAVRQDIARGCANDSAVFPPVSDQSSGVVYKNEYCAVCNGARGVAQWNYALGCTEWLSVQIVLARLGYVILEITTALLNRECIVCGYKPPQLNTSSNARTCYPQVTTCLDQGLLSNYTKDTAGYEQLVELCETGDINLVVSSLGKGSAYHNKYCAECNGVSEVECASPRRIAMSITSPCATLAEDKLGNQIRPPSQPGPTSDDIQASIIGAPFSLVLDVGGSGVTATSTTTTLSIAVTCANGELFDPSTQGCRPTVCPGVFEGEGCVFTTSSNSSCAASNTTCSVGLIQLTREDEFQIVDNCTVVFLNRTYLVYYYEGDDPVICADLERNGTVFQNVTDRFYNYPRAYFVLTYVGCSLSLLGAVIILVTIALFKEIRSLSMMILANIASTILVSTLFLLIGGPVAEATQSRGLCVSVAIILHLFFLAQFSWMCILSVEIMLTLFRGIKLRPSPARTELQKSFVLYFFLGWSIPIVIIAISVTLNFVPSTSHLVLYGRLDDGTDGLCWINHKISAIIAFLVPVATTIAVNLVLLSIISSILLRGFLNQRQLNTTGTLYMYVRIYVVVVLTSGATWLFGFLALLVDSVWAWYPFIALNSLMGFALFMAFFFTRKVGFLYLRLVSCGRLDYSVTQTSSAGGKSGTKTDSYHPSTPQVVRLQLKERAKIEEGEGEGPKGPVGDSNFKDVTISSSHL